MIENPPLIQIKKIKEESKPSLAQIAQFQNIPTGFICDALEGYAALNGNIKLLDDTDKKLHVVGTALTVESGAADVLGMQIVLNEIKTIAAIRSPPPPTDGPTMIHMDCSSFFAGCWVAST